MSTSDAERQAIWDAFLQRWPLAALDAMTLAQYNVAGDKDCFTQWLEAKTAVLGSIWGGSSFKFGVYSRKDQSDKPDGRGLRFTATHAWMAKYGDTPQQAFSKVLGIIVSIAKAANQGHLEVIEAADLGTVTKWKIAFLYQDRASPSVLPIYRLDSLRSVSGGAMSSTCADLHSALMAQRGQTDLLTYGDQIWKKIQTLESAKLTTDQAHAYFKEPDRFTAIKAFTEKMAGFRTLNGLELALALDNKTPTLYLSAGAWLDEVKAQLDNVVAYAPGKSRSSNIAANAPTLSVGNAIVKVTVPTMSALHSLCDAYEGVEPTGATLPTPPMTAREHATMGTPPLNQILYGPPGTGKTFETINVALEILDAPFLAANVKDRAALRGRFAELEKAKRVRFTTFHQSFSYEDFVEGIRANIDADTDASAKGVRYSIELGVFGELCQDAKRDKQLEDHVGIREGAKVWKISIEEASSTGDTRKYCLANGEARIGWPDAGDLSVADMPEIGKKLGTKVQSSLDNFSQQIVIGDILLCLGSRTSISAVGVVTGDYEYTPVVPAGVRKDYVNKLPVHWLVTNINFEILEINKGVGLTLQTVYPLTRIGWPDLLQALTAAGVNLNGPAPTSKAIQEPYVLIIDEINRGSVSRIFGELITLIEPSKRAGADEALEAILPYSKKAFSVPGNVYLVGTMNTADRSLAGLDVALRRRFVFREMPPRPELLYEVLVEGIDVGQMLSVLNRRIEALLDREHCLGHAYFLPLKGEPTLARLASIFRHQILPLLQEYFFEDWQRIHWVLNDHRKTNPSTRFVAPQPWSAKDLFGDDVIVSHNRQAWTVNEAAFSQAESYLELIDHALTT
jgi:5-methylcytosine-specific restriction protein B